VGKTTLQILIATVAASRGNIVIVLDPKLRFSRAFRHPVTREPLPNVLVYRHPDPETAAREWEGILAVLVEEQQRRYELDDAAPTSILADHERFPRIVIVVDELGNLLDFADKEWSQRKQEYGLKGDTPVRGYLHSLHRMGAEAGLIMCSANQTASENEMPAGTRTRTLCGQRIFLGPIKEGPQWRMLAGEGVERPDIPAGQKGAGAIIVGTGRPWRFQSAFIDWKDRPEGVYNLAGRGVPLLRSRGHVDDRGHLLLAGRAVPRPGQMASQVADGVLSVTPPATPSPPVVPTSPTPTLPAVRMIVGLAAAAEFCGMSVPNFRKWRELCPIPNEAPKFEGNKPAWPEPDLREWSLQRADSRRDTRQEMSA